MALTNNPSFLGCCDCEDECRDPTKCACVRSMGGTPAYSADRRLMEPKLAIYEVGSGPKCVHVCVRGSGGVRPKGALRCTKTGKLCGGDHIKTAPPPSHPSFRTRHQCNYRCRCHKSVCRNRVVGRGVREPLTVFRCTPVAKGWGVRARHPIAAGSFVAEYVGEVRTVVCRTAAR